MTQGPVFRNNVIAHSKENAVSKTFTQAVYSTSRLQRQNSWQPNKDRRYFVDLKAQGIRIAVSYFHLLMTGGPPGERTVGLQGNSQLINHRAITNEYNDGANSLKNFLHYAEAVCKGDEAMARRVLENLNPLTRTALAPLCQNDAVIEGPAAALPASGYTVAIPRCRCATR